MVNMSMNRNDDYTRNLSPLDPPAFPDPILDSCVRISSNVRDRNGAIKFHRNAILIKTRDSAPFSLARAGRFIVDNKLADMEYSSNSSISYSSEGEIEDVSERPQQNECAYLICDERSDAIYGKVYHGIVLRRSSLDNVWQMTADECAIKAMTWERIRKGFNNKQTENPQDEIAAMQHLMRHLNGAKDRQISAHDAMRETGVIMPLDFLFDFQQLYMITPFCSGGEIFGVLKRRRCFSESESRYLFRSILDGLDSLRRGGVCHRDISLENILIDHEQTFVIDMGMCLRIPFLNNEGGDIDMPRNVDYRDRSTQRCLIGRRNRAGKLLYMAPEVYSQRSFDGHIVDMWAAGVCLFMMLTGQNAWERPASHDKLFKHISSQGKLADILIKHWHIPISEDATDLLQQMLFKNPEDRLSLQQVRDHPWMDGPMSNPMSI